MPELAKPTCPRCAYDLCGIVESWQESCPLQGVCSECGLDFEWREVFHANELTVPGFHEHAGGIAFSSAWRTFAWTLLPWKFWKKVRIEYPVRPVRVLLWLVVLLLPLQLMHVANAVAQRLWSPAFAGSGATLRIITPVPGPNTPRPQRRTAASAPTVGSSMIWYGVVPDALDPLLARNSRYPRWSPSSVGASLSLADLVGGTIPGFLRWPVYGLTLVFFGGALVFMLVALPQTRARAKVQMVHVLRAAVYGCSWLVWLALLRAVSEIVQWARALAAGWTAPPTGIFAPPVLRGSVMESVAEHSFVVIWITGTWLAVWWLCALRTGFRIREWRIVWIAMLVPSLLVLIIVLTMISPQFANFFDLLMRGRLRWS